MEHTALLATYLVGCGPQSGDLAYIAVEHPPRGRLGKVDLYNPVPNVCGPSPLASSAVVSLVEDVYACEQELRQAPFGSPEVIACIFERPRDAPQRPASSSSTNTSVVLRVKQAHDHLDTHLVVLDELALGRLLHAQNHAGDAVDAKRAEGFARWKSVIPDS